MQQRPVPHRYALATGAIILTALFGTLTPAGATAQGSTSVFAPVAAALTNVLIPVALPTVLPLTSSTLHLYASIQSNSVSATTYSVDIGFARDCHGGTACRYGEVTGGWTLDTPGVMSPDTGGTPIVLHGGMKGTYYPFTCGASCGDSVILWHTHGIPYTVSIKAGSRNAVLQMANSAIANTKSPL